MRLLPPITPTRNSMIAEGFRVWLLPARTPTQNPLDFEAFRVEEMSGKWKADFQHSRLALPHTIDPRTGSVPGQNKRENGRTNKPNPNTKRLPLFNVGDLNGTRGIENQKPHRVWVCFCSFFVFPNGVWLPPTRTLKIRRPFVFGFLLFILRFPDYFVQGR